MKSQAFDSFRGTLALIPDESVVLLHASITLIGESYLPHPKLNPESTLDKIGLNNKNIALEQGWANYGPPSNFLRPAINF